MLIPMQENFEEFGEGRTVETMVVIKLPHLEKMAEIPTRISAIVRTSATM
jgi:hypothetical protein